MISEDEMFFHIHLGNSVYVQRKHPQSGSDTPLAIDEKVIIALCNRLIENESKVQQMIDEAVKISQARMHSAIFEVENNPDFNYSEHMNMLENELRQVFNTDNGRD